MNKITFSITYYGQVDRLQYQLDFFDKLPAKTKQDVKLQILNDGYNDGGVFESLLELYKDRLDLKGYKITTDIGFNRYRCVHGTNYGNCYGNESIKRRKHICV